LSHWIIRSLGTFAVQMQGLLMQLDHERASRGQTQGPNLCHMSFHRLHGHLRVVQTAPDPPYC
jgi:hypothetical protein